jgi:hypothetical protein
MKRTFQIIVGGVALLLFYAYVVIPLQEYYSTPGVTVPAAIPANLQEEEEIQVVETEALILASVNTFKVEAKRLEINVHDARNNWDAQTFEWWESKKAWKWLWGRGINMRGLGYVTASFDLSLVRRSDITRDGDVFVVNVGAPNISHVVLPAKNVYHVTKPYQGNSVSADDLLRLERYSRMQLERSLREKACSDDIFLQASQNIKKDLPNFLRLTNGDTVKIRIETRIGECVA